VTYRSEKSDGNRDTRMINFSAAGHQTFEGGDTKAGSSGAYWTRLHVLTPNKSIESGDVHADVQIVSIGAGVELLRQPNL
jgi:hypothetical protein